MKPLSKGDPCRVRLYGGEVVEAVYDEPVVLPEYWQKCHWVTVDYRSFFAREKIKQPGECRFVGNPCVLAPVEVSNESH